MVILHFRDQTTKGERVEFVRPCRNCRDIGSLVISNGQQGVVVHFEHQSEIGALISQIRKECGDGAQV